MTSSRPSAVPSSRYGEIGADQRLSPKFPSLQQALAVLAATPKWVVGTILPHVFAYVWATLAIGVAALVAAGIEGTLALPNLSLVFLSAVLFVGVRLGTAPALYAAGLGFAVYNFFYTAPYFTFIVHDRGDVLTLMFFVLVAVLTGNLAGRVRSQLEAVRESARRTNILYDLARDLADARSIDKVQDTISIHVAETFGARSLVFLAAADCPSDLTAVATHPADGGASEDDRAAAERAWRNGDAAGSTSESGPAAAYLFAPMKTGHGTIGLVGLALPPRDARLSAEQQQLFEALADQSAVAIERARLSADIEKARLLSETESLRTALLSSISHDLRTPLSSIIGSATTLASVWESLSSTDRRDLTDTILEESNRLNSLVQNLLDMTRIEHGGLEPRRDWVDLREIVGRAVYRLRDPLLPFHVLVEFDDKVPLLYLDPVLMEQVFVNILDNAAKHAPSGSAIFLTATCRDGTVEVRIEDEGPGIAPEDRTVIFEMFFRRKVAGTRAGGTGLGLSICKAFIEVHRGTIAAESAANGTGTGIVMSLPVAQLPFAKAG